MDCEESQQVSHQATSSSLSSPTIFDASSGDETRVPPRQPGLPSRISGASSMSDEQSGQMDEQMQKADIGMSRQVSRLSSSADLMTISMVLERTSKQLRPSSIRRLPDSPQKPVLPGSPRSSPPSLPSSAPAPPELVMVTLEYLEDEDPSRDILELDGGKGSPVVITRMALGGKARKAGVRTGAILHRINGVDDFQSLPHWEVLGLLQAPSILELKQLPAPTSNSPRCKEIRIVAKNREPGMRLRQGPWRQEDRVSVVESKVFLPGRAALLLTSFPDEEDAERKDAVFDSWALRQYTPRGPTFYELRRLEAYNLVDEAAKAAWDIATRKTNYVTQLGRRSTRQRPTSTPLLCDKLWAALEKQLLRDQGGEQDPVCCIPVADCKITGLDTSQCQWV